jgi:hypothetical protein
MRAVRDKGKFMMSLEISDESLSKLREDTVESTDDTLTTEGFRNGGKAYWNTAL